MVFGELGSLDSIGSDIVNVAVENSCDKSVIVEKFADYFSAIQDPPVSPRESIIERDLNCAYSCAMVNMNTDAIDITCIDRVIRDLKKGKTPGPDNISVEHLLYSHESLACILSYLFNWILITSSVPDLFCLSFTVPIPKRSDNVTRVSSKVQRLSRYCSQQCFFENFREMFVGLILRSFKDSRRSVWFQARLRMYDCDFLRKNLSLGSIVLSNPRTVVHQPKTANINGKNQGFPLQGCKSQCNHTSKTAKINIVPPSAIQP